MTTEDPPVWKGSKEKLILYNDIVAGVVKEESKPKDVYEMHDGIYKKFVYTNFRSNLRTLKNMVKEQMEQATDDATALDHDLAIVGNYYSSTKPRWHNSDAEKLLKEDIDAGRHNRIDPKTGEPIKPSKFRLDRLEYRVFDLDVFRNHIYQELRARRERPYWMAKKAKEHAEKEKEQKMREAAKAAVEEQKAKAAAKKAAAEEKKKEKAQKAAEKKKEKERKAAALALKKKEAALKKAADTEARKAKLEAKKIAAEAKKAATEARRTNKKNGNAC